MASSRSQSSRLAFIQTSLGADVVVLDRFTLTSRLSEPFLVLADVRADGPVDFHSALYKPVVIATRGVGKGLERHVHGVLFAVERHDDSEDSAHYQLVVRPWLAALAERSDLRIFQNQGVKDILQAVFSAAGFNDFDMSGLTGSYPAREYCVQFRETDLAFVSRLMEDEGIYYYFKHSADRHVMVLCDGPGAHHTLEGLPQVKFLGNASERSSRGVTIWRWSERLGTAPAKLDLTEHHFLIPAANNLGTEAVSCPGVHPASALYDHPAGVGGYAENSVIKSGLPAQTKRHAQSRLEAMRAETQKFFGETNAFAVSCGDKLALVEHPQASLNMDYLLVAATHVYSGASYQSGGQEDFHLEVHLEAIPFATPWRPTHRTPKPLTGGPQTARVVGPLQNPGATDDTIHVDENGRVKVQFYWDRRGKLDQNSSCWVRVSQGWADGGYGAVLLPRIGQDVIVDFLDGDPDRPIITGRVYNAARMPPYPLPAKKTVSTLKSRSVGSPGSYPEAENPPESSTPGFNELRFEDDAGKEEVFIHAQRDMNTWVRFDETKKNGRDTSQRVGRNKTVSIKKNLSTTLDEGDETRTLTKGSRTTTIKTDEKLTVQSGDMSTTVQTGNQTTDIQTGNLTTKVDTGNHATTVSMGNLTIDVSMGKATITAMQSIELTVGGSSIKMTPASIEMSAPTVKINADAAFSAQGGMTAEVKGGIMLTLSGGIVMIN